MKVLITTNFLLAVCSFHNSLDDGVKQGNCTNSIRIFYSIVTTVDKGGEDEGDDEVISAEDLQSAVPSPNKLVGNNQTIRSLSPKQRRQPRTVQFSVIKSASCVK